jgi:muramidase (phage lysozyme)
VTNLEAFLATLRSSEGTAKYPNPYAVTFGGKFTITDFRDHPALLGTWHGEPLDFLGPQYKGLVSTAAGAYQLIKPTWLAAKTVLRLPDFGVASQDAAATLLIREHGALDLVNAGEIAAAIAKCSSVWASLPGGTSGQPQHPVDQLLAWYGSAGGALA